MIQRIALAALLLFMPALCAGQSPVRLSKDTLYISIDDYNFVWLYNDSPETLSIDSIFIECNAVPSFITIGVQPSNKNLRDEIYWFEVYSSNGVSYPVRFRVLPQDSVRLEFLRFLYCDSTAISTKDTVFGILVFKNSIILDSLKIIRAFCPPTTIQKPLSYQLLPPIKNQKYPFDYLGRRIFLSESNNANKRMHNFYSLKILKY